MGIGVLRFYGGDNRAQGPMVGIGVLRFYGGDRSAQGLWRG